MEEMKSEKDSIMEDIKDFKDAGYTESAESLRLFYRKMQAERSALIRQYGKETLEKLYQSVNNGINSMVKRKSKDFFEEMRFIVEGSGNEEDISDALNHYGIKVEYFDEIAKTNPIRMKREVYTIMEEKLDGLRRNLMDTQNPQLKTPDQWRDMYDIEESDDQMNEFRLIHRELVDAKDLHKVQAVRDNLTVWPRMEAWYRGLREFAYTLRNAVLLSGVIESKESRLFDESAKEKKKNQEDIQTTKDTLQTEQNKLTNLKNDVEAKEKLLKQQDDQFKQTRDAMTTMQAQRDTAKADYDKIRQQHIDEIANARKRIEALEEVEKGLRQKISKADETESKKSKKENDESDAKKSPITETTTKTPVQPINSTEEDMVKDIEPTVPKGYTRIKGVDYIAKIEPMPNGAHSKQIKRNGKWMSGVGAIKRVDWELFKRDKKLLDVK